MTSRISTGRISIRTVTKSEQRGNLEGLCLSNCGRSESRVTFSANIVTKILSVMPAMCLSLTVWIDC